MVKKRKVIIIALLLLIVFVNIVSVIFNKKLEYFVTVANNNTTKINSYLAVNEIFLESCAVYIETYLNSDIVESEEYYRLVRKLDFFEEDGQPYYKLKDGAENNVSFIGIGNREHIMGREKEMSILIDMTSTFADYKKKVPQIKEIIYISDMEFMYMYSETEQLSLDFVINNDMHQVYDTIVSRFENEDSIGKGENANTILITDKIIDLVEDKEQVSTSATAIYNNGKIMGIIIVRYDFENLINSLSDEYAKVIVDRNENILYYDVDNHKYTLPMREKSVEDLQNLIETSYYNPINLLYSEYDVEGNKLNIEDNMFMYKTDFMYDKGGLYELYPLEYVIMYAFIFCIPIVIIIVVLIYFVIKYMELSKEKNFITDEIQEILDNRDEIEEVINIDKLTRLYTRRVIYMQLTEIKSICSECYSIIMCDIDHFKKVNDNYGHNVGDLILKNTSKIILNHPYTEKFAARWGGEEIIILLPDMDTEEAFNFAEELRKDISVSSVKSENDVDVRVTVSFGVATTHNLDLNPFEVIKRADQTLYKSKNKGRNRVTVYEEV